MDSTSRAVPPSLGHPPADRPYAELTGGHHPSGVRWASFAETGSPPPYAPAGHEPGKPLLRPWGTGAGGLLPGTGKRAGAAAGVGQGTRAAAEAAAGTVPAVPVPRGIPVL
ncbi:hypothetical protein ABZ484_09325 [Streptomyces sp. NPDC006393]|uniref:hypothetical protein n=1 Tax=Streptomyces sp. NPDC006393 TaxID=3156763 RepID=UPI0033FEA03C